MKVCMLSSVHSADDIRIVEKEARSLAALGHAVTVVARLPGPRDPGDIEFKLIDVPTVSRWKRPWVNGRAAVALARSTRPDVVHFHDPELIPLALMLKSHGCAVIYDVHEDVPADIYSKTWIPSLLRPIVAWGDYGSSLRRYRRSDTRHSRSLSPLRRSRIGCTKQRPAGRICRTHPGDETAQAGRVYWTYKF